jgi:hypothetical protein
MLERTTVGVAFCLTAFALAATQACAEDPTIERSGGPEVGPQGDGGAGVVDVPSGAGTAAGGTSQGPVAFCAALTVVRAKCQRCHGSPLQNGAPAPFITYEDTQAPYYATTQKWTDVMGGAVMRGFMPYVALNDPPTSLTPAVQPLTVEEKATLLGWLSEGALPEGGTNCP